MPYIWHSDCSLDLLEGGGPFNDPGQRGRLLDWHPSKGQYSLLIRVQKGREQSRLFFLYEEGAFSESGFAGFNFCGRASYGRGFWKIPVELQDIKRTHSKYGGRNHGTWKKAVRPWKPILGSGIREPHDQLPQYAHLFKKHQMAHHCFDGSLILETQASSPFPECLRPQLKNPQAKPISG